MSEIKSGQSVRKSSIELLRIIAMVMIVFHHFAVHGGFTWTSSSNLLTQLWYLFIIMGGKVGVNVFVFITGYYLIKSKDDFFRPIKILKFWGQVFFYSAVIFAIFLLCGSTSFGISELIKNLLPITYGKWWFASTYFVLYLFHPFINKLLCNLEKGLYQKLLILLVVCWSILPTFTKSSFESNSLLWFVTLYAISGYIRLYGLNPKFGTKFYLALFIISSGLTYLSSVVLTLLADKWSIFEGSATYFYGQEKITTLTVSLSLFLLFATLNMGYHKWINVIASATFGVYLIHDNTLVRKFLWLELFQNANYQESPLLIPYSIGVSLLVYAVCTLIDWLRQLLLERPLMKAVTPIVTKERQVPKILMRLKDVFFGKQ